MNHGVNSHLLTYVIIKYSETYVPNIFVLIPFSTLPLISPKFLTDEYNSVIIL